MVWDANKAKTCSKRQNKANNKIVQKTKKASDGKQGIKGKKAKTKKQKNKKQKSKRKANKQTDDKKGPQAQKPSENVFRPSRFFGLGSGVLHLVHRRSRSQKSEKVGQTPAGEGKVLKIPAVSTVWFFLLFSF